MPSRRRRLLFIDDVVDQRGGGTGAPGHTVDEPLSALLKVLRDAFEE